MSSGEWERVLWKTQPYPDNYIPRGSFLSALRKNRKLKLVACAVPRFFESHLEANFRPYTYWPLVVASWAVTQHLSTIFIFLAIFVRLKERWLDPRILVWASLACFVTGYIVWELLDSSDGDNERRRVDRSCFFAVIH
jgi:phosphatidylinositol glycan class C protein